MEKLLNVATPLTAVFVNVPLSVAPEVPVPLEIATVTEALLLATRTPLLSFTFTVTAGDMEAPDAVLVGCCPNASARPVCGHATEVFKLGVPGSSTQT